MTNIWAALYREYVADEIDEDSTDELIFEVKEALYSYIARELKESGEIKPPLLRSFDSPYIKGRGVNSVILASRIAVDACLVPKRGGFEIFIKESLPYFRQRLCLAHELAHTYFYKFIEGRDYPVHVAKSAKKYMQVDWKLDEGFTYEIAREILLPRFLIRKIKHKNIDLNMLFVLQRKFAAPISLIAKRAIHDLKYLDSCFIIAEYEKGGVRTGTPKVIYKGESFKRISIRKLWRKAISKHLMNCNMIDLDPGEIVTFDMEDYNIVGETTKIGNKIFTNLEIGNGKKRKTNKTLLDFV